MQKCRTIELSDYRHAPELNEKLHNAVFIKQSSFILFQQNQDVILSFSNVSVVSLAI